MYSICCTLPKPDYKAEFTPEEFKRFCFLVHEYRKSGYDLNASQDKACSEIMIQSIPFDSRF